jgi:quercetin dioxygenase-like cupin family protein
MKKALMVTAALIALTGSAVAQLNVDTMKVFQPDALTWHDEPTLPKGGQSVLLFGDPTKPEMFVARVKFPPHFKVAPHTHPSAELITIISGSLGNGMGETFDAKKGEMLKTGSSFALPAKHAHFVWTENEETVVELVATGPWGIEYVNPADDPRRQPK